jgi:SAM-dependent methyltransferase
MSDTSFDSNQFWRERLGGEVDLDSVGHRSLGAAYNAHIYQRRQEVLSDTLQEFSIQPGISSVLEAGCGSGYWVDFWRCRGVARLVGLDLSDQCICELSRRFPTYDFITADITASESPLRGESFDIITAFDVFYHIVDDRKLERALNHLASLMSEDGTLWVFDQLLAHDYALRPHVKFRARSRFAAMLQSAGLRISTERPLFGLLAPPVLGIRPVDLPIHAAYQLTGIVMKRWKAVGTAVGRSVSALDQLLRRFRLEIPNHKLFVIEKESRP